MHYKRTTLLMAAVVAAGTLLSGCAYYQLTDRETGAVYYTTDQQASWSSNIFLQSVQFTDGRTGQVKSLVHPRIQTITQAEYEQAIAGHHRR